MWGTSVLSYSLLFLLALSPLLVSYAYLVLTQYFHIIMCVCWFVSVAAAFYKQSTNGCSRFCASSCNQRCLLKCQMRWVKRQMLQLQECSHLCIICFFTVSLCCLPTKCRICRREQSYRSDTRMLLSQVWYKYI